jgi:nucleoside-diphosphate-sugar epimerase
MKLLMTGATGHMARLALAGLKGRHELRLADLREPDGPLPEGAEFVRADLLGAGEAEFAALFEGAEVVVHSAYVRSGGVDVYATSPPHLDRFESELDNVRMAQRVYRQALESGVRRVVVVSSNHAADWYEHAQVHIRGRDQVTPEDLPLSDNFYGWAKASYELLGYPYACGTFGRRLEVVLLRIGSPYPVDPEAYTTDDQAPLAGPVRRPTGLAGFKRALGTFLSEGDCARLFVRAVEAEDIADRHGVPWVVAYGISDNTRGFWSLTSAREVLGYHPQDDSEVLYADAVRRLLVPDDGRGSPGRLGDARAEKGGGGWDPSSN